MYVLCIMFKIVFEGEGERKKKEKKGKVMANTGIYRYTTTEKERNIIRHTIKETND